jgi:hypothetical protein
MTGSSICFVKTDGKSAGFLPDRPFARTVSKPGKFSGDVSLHLLVRV